MTQQDWPTHWSVIPFRQAIVDLPIKVPGKIQARNYRDQGRFPIIDQGRSPIAGWTDDESVVISKHLPYVVFGDHTRVFKYVDSAFALGADGTQLLKPHPEFHPLFFYYACRSLELPSRGYNRHFGLLKEQDFPKPPTDEQESIAALLDLVDETLNALRSKEHYLAEFSTALLKDLMAGRIPVSQVKVQELLLAQPLIEGTDAT